MKLFASLLLALVAVSAKSIKPRIIGGSEAIAGQFPYIAAVYTTKSDGGTYFCSGTLINSDWLVTAASCIDGALVSTIHLGSNSLSTNNDNTIRLSTDTHIVHPDYDPATFDNDIGLIKFRIPILYNNYVKGVEFLADGILPQGSSTITAGWGQIDDENPAPVDKLNFVYVVSLSNDECKLAFGDQITDNMVCVDGNYNQGICNGDIGSPLIQYVSRGHTMLVGVASFLSGNGCTSTDPSGFTRLFPYKDWITNTTAPTTH